MFPLLCLSLALGAEPDPAMTLDRLAQLLDECEVIPPRECGHRKVVRRSEKGLVADEYENVFFTTDTNCSNYYYGQADAGLPVALKMIECRNPEYAFSLMPDGDTYNVYHFEIARRCLLETKKNANYIGGVSPGLSEAEVSLYHTFSSLVAWNRDRFSDLIRNPATRCTILRKSPLHFALTGRSMEPQPGGPERFSATIRISRSGKYAYVTESHGTVTYGNGQRHEATIVNEVVEMETHPRLVSSKVTHKSLNVNPPSTSIEERLFQYGPEFVRGHKPVFRKSDFGMPEPFAWEFVTAEPATPPAAPSDWHLGSNYYWVLGLTSVGIALSVLGRRFSRPRSPN